MFINNIADYIFTYLFFIIDGYKKINNIIINKKYLILFIIILIIIIMNNICFVRNNEIKKVKSINNINTTQIKYNNSYLNYILICKKKIRLKRIKNCTNKFPFISICIPVYNTDKYIEQSILSVINQSFQDFEIIIVNDFSNDDTERIIKKLQLEDNRIKIIKHNKNLGVYHSRVEAVLNSKGKYILFLDPDDMLLNANLFKELYSYNYNKNLDIIEFLVYHQIEGTNKIYCPKKHILNHNHNYLKKIIYQPELSEILFYQPRKKKYSYVICRTIWNKIYKREIQLKTIKYIGEKYYNNENLIVADDTMINIINFNFANNYSNNNLPGYLYNVKKSSMSRGYFGKQHRIRQNISFLFYFNLLYKYIIDYNKDINMLYYEIKITEKRFLEFKSLNIENYLNNLKIFLNNIKNNKKSSKRLKDLINSIYNNLFFLL